MTEITALGTAVLLAFGLVLLRPDAVNAQAPNPQPVSPEPVSVDSTPSSSPPNVTAPAAAASEPDLPARPSTTPAQAANAAVNSPAMPLSPVPKVAEWIERSYPVPDTTVVMTAPQTDAEHLGRIRRGTEVEVVGLLTDPMWLQVRLPDKSLGYVLASSVPAVAQSGDSPAPVVAKPTVSENADVEPPLPPQVPAEGEAVLFTTSVVLLSDASYPLADVDGFNGPTRNEMADFLKSSEGWVHCEPAAANGFICKLHDGTDLAKAALVNGAVRAKPTASRDYIAQQENAKANHRGIWHDGAADVDAIAFSDGLGLGPQPAGHSYVPGVAYAGPEGVPAAFVAAGPQDGLALIDGQPFTLDEGIPAPLVFEPAVGWGFWDRSFVWRRAPPGWRRKLEQFHPHGEGLREVDLEHRGFALHQTFFHGPAVNAALALGHPSVPLGSSPYLSPVFRAVGRPMTDNGSAPRFGTNESRPLHAGPQLPGTMAPGRQAVGGASSMNRPMPGQTPKASEGPYGRAPQGAGTVRAGMPPGPPANHTSAQGPAAMLANRQATQAGRMQPPLGVVTARPVAMAHPAPAVRAPPPVVVKRH